MKRFRIGLIVVAALVSIVDLVILFFYKLDDNMKLGIVLTLFGMLMVILRQVLVTRNLSMKKFRIWEIVGAALVSIVDLAILCLYKFDDYMKFGLVLILLGMLMVILGNVLKLKKKECVVL